MAQDEFDIPYPGAAAGSSAFLVNITKDYEPDPDDLVEESLLTQYERVIVESLLTGFGLDSLVHDQHGGDVDTIRNVRQGIYKNEENRRNYETLEAYDGKAYHSDKAYTSVVHEAREEFQKSGRTIDDTYVPGNKVMPVTTKSVPRQRQGQLDHVVAAKEIHDDPGRVLAGIDGKSLANSHDNLRYTNAALNRNMSDKSVDEYLQWCQEHPDKVNWNGTPGEPLPEEVKTRLRREYDRAHAAYDLKLAQKYYASPAFLKDTLVSAKNVAKAMGIRQAVGFVLAEVIVVTSEEMRDLPRPFELGRFLRQLGESVRHGFQSALEKYKTLLARFAQGALAGALSSVSTTLCNIFFTTAKNVVRLIRQVWAALVRAAEILFINPDRYPFGERMRMVVTVIGTGTSVVLGTIVQEAVLKTSVGAIPHIGGSVAAFCGTLVSGLLSCTLVYYLNHSQKIRQLVDTLNTLPDIDNSAEMLRRQALYFERMAADMAQIDYDAFRREVEMYGQCADQIGAAASEEELNTTLKAILTRIGMPIPWGEGSFDDFMHDKNRRLVIG